MVSNQVKNDEPADYEVTASLSMYVCRIVHVRMYGRHRLQLLQLVNSRLLSSGSLHVGLYYVMDNSEQTPGYMLVCMWPSFNNTTAQCTYDLACVMTYWCTGMLP